MSFASQFKNIVSFGAQGRTERAIEDYNRLRDEVQGVIDGINARTAAVNGEMQRVVTAKLAAVQSLRRMQTIAKNLSARDRDLRTTAFGEAFAQKDLAAVNQTISAVELVTGAATGVKAGVSTALGAWTLVGAFGTASTGTAIGSLSGAALTNATLAWFGGGAVTAGGLGMAGGALVLGGIVVVPAAALSAVFSHLAANKKIEQIKGEELKLVEAFDECKKMEITLDLADQRSRELTSAIDKAREVLDAEITACRQAIYPWGWISRSVRWLKRVLTGRYFFQSDLVEVAHLAETAAAAAHLIDQKVLNSGGDVIRGELHAKT